MSEEMEVFSVVVMRPQTGSTMTVELEAPHAFAAGSIAQAAMKGWFVVAVEKRKEKVEDSGSEC
jgi:hypothetical protein